MADDVVIEILKRIQADLSGVQADLSEVKEDVGTLNQHMMGVSGMLMQIYGKQLDHDERLAALEESRKP